MMNVKIFKAFIASPGDTQNERNVAEKVVDEINQTLGDFHKFRLELLKWETNTYPDFGADGQDVINKQIGLDYNIFIGVMWKRFGTPTNRAESGTEEEFERAYKKYKGNGELKIMFYFNSSPIPQENLDLEQLKKVGEFKSKVKELGGYYWSYDSIGSFEKNLRVHLQKALLSLISKKEQETTEIQIERIEPKIRQSFQTYLNDIEASFSHRRVDKVYLKDFYIAPDLKNVNDAKKGISYKSENLSNLSDAIDTEGIRFILLGNELAGKTTVCKYLFSKYFQMGLYPVLLNGNDINNNIRVEGIIRAVENKIREQYEVPFSYSYFPQDRFILIIDDFHKASKGKNRYWPILVSNIEKSFNNVVFTGSALMPIEDLSKREAFTNFNIYAILEFGPKFRYELVNKWNTLGLEKREIHDKQNEILRKNDYAIAHIKTIIGKNYISSYPFYLLTILQAMESSNVQNPNYSIHGFYYELLINESIGKAVKDNREISLYYNYLTSLCYFLFENGKKEISFQELDDFHLAYCEKHDLSYKLETIINTFNSAKIICMDDRVYIKEKYVYYFFVAKYISNNINKDENIRRIVTKMTHRMFRDEYASIIMFITHLSKEDFIIDELIKNANSIFPEIQPAKLAEDINCINELIAKLPEQVLELVDINEKRAEELEDQEEVERTEKEFEKENKSYDNYNLDDDISSIDFYAKITLALKTIDILGQVTKKHWGELDGIQKLNLVQSTYNLGLRTLNGFLQFLQNNSAEIIESVKQLILEKHIKDRYDLKQSIDEIAHKYVFKHCFLASWGITKRVSNSIGYDKLKKSFERVLILQPYNSVKLIDLAIKLGYSGIPMDIVKSYAKEMDNNKLGFLVLQNLIIDHCYMFDTDHITKSQLSSILNFGIQEQLKIDATSTVKKKK